MRPLPAHPHTPTAPSVRLVRGPRARGPGHHQTTITSHLEPPTEPVLTPPEDCVCSEVPRLRLRENVPFGLHGVDPVSLTPWRWTRKRSEGSRCGAGEAVLAGV